MLRSPFAILALVAGTYALTIRSTCGCSFHLSTGGDVTGPVGEDSQGEVLEGSSLTAASFCLNGNTITDSHGNPCWFTPPTYVLQCDYGAIPAAGFSIGCNGEVSFNGQTTFYECHNGIGDEVNLYLKPDEGANCGSITLTADSCHTSCVTSTTCAASRTVTVTYTEIETVSVCPSPTTTPPPPPPPPTTCTTRSTTATTTSTKSTGTCPMELPSLYQFPHLIVPIDSSNPSTAAGTSYFGQVSSTISTIFNFDIPSSYTGQCTLWFLFPTQAELVTSSFTLSGSGSVEFFGGLDGVATQSTSFSNAPHATLNLGQFTLAPGNAYDIYTFSCPSGTAVSFEMTANDDTAFKYFQDFNECPIGLYVVLN